MNTTGTGSTRRGVVRGRVRPAAGVGRVVERLEAERRRWARHRGGWVPTERAWRAGVAEGLRLAQAVIRRGV